MAHYWEGGGEGGEIGDFLISLSLLICGSVLTHHAACHHARNPYPTRTEPHATQLSSVKVEFRPIRKWRAPFSVLQTLSRSGGIERVGLWYLALVTNPSDGESFIVLQGGDSHTLRRSCKTNWLFIMMLEAWNPFLNSFRCSENIIMHRESIQYQSLWAGFQIVALITAGDAGSSSLTAKCSFLLPYVSKCEKMHFAFRNIYIYCAVISIELNCAFESLFVAILRCDMWQFCF